MSTIVNFSFDLIHDIARVSAMARGATVDQNAVDALIAKWQPFVSRTLPVGVSVEGSKESLGPFLVALKNLSALTASVLSQQALLGGSYAIHTKTAFERALREANSELLKGLYAEGEEISMMVDRIMSGFKAMDIEVAIPDGLRGAPLAMDAIKAWAIAADLMSPDRELQSMFNARLHLSGDDAAGAFDAQSTGALVSGEGDLIIHTGALAPYYTRGNGSVVQGYAASDAVVPLWKNAGVIRTASHVEVSVSVTYGRNISHVLANVTAGAAVIANLFTSATVGTLNDIPASVSPSAYKMNATVNAQSIQHDPSTGKLLLRWTVPLSSTDDLALTFPTLTANSYVKFEARIHGVSYLSSQLLVLNAGGDAVTASAPLRSVMGKLPGFFVTRMEMEAAQRVLSFLHDHFNFLISGDASNDSAANIITVLRNWASEKLAWPSASLSTIDARFVFDMLGWLSNDIGAVSAEPQPQARLYRQFYHLIPTYLGFAACDVDFMKERGRAFSGVYV